MFPRSLALALLTLGATAALAQTPAQPTTPAATPARPPRPAPPTRDPHTPGYVPATDLPDGTLPPATADGNFVLGPTHTAAPEMSVQPGVPQGKVYEFTMSSADSKLYPGIARDANTFGTPDPANPAKLIVTTSHPAPYTRHLAVHSSSARTAPTAASSPRSTTSSPLTRFR
jgi:hypothetical protein